MGRPERPIPSHAQKETAVLAVRLRAHRQHAGHSYAELAEITGMTTTRLSRAASGDSVPPLAVAEAYARGCGADNKETAEIGKLWRAARRATHPGKPERMLHITLVNDAGDLWTAMVHLYLRVGRPPLRELEKRAGSLGELPRSTTSLVLRGLARPSRPFLEHFVRACGVSKSEIREWLSAWDRANRTRTSEASTPWGIDRGDTLAFSYDPATGYPRPPSDEQRLQAALEQAHTNFRTARSVAERRSAQQQAWRVASFLDHLALQKSANTTFPAARSPRPHGPRLQEVAGGP